MSVIMPFSLVFNKAFTLPSNLETGIWLFLPLLPCILVCLFFLVIFTFYLYRTFVSMLAKWLDPQITRILSGLSASLVRDYDCHLSKPLSSIVVCMKCHGSHTFEQFCKELQEKFILRKSSHSKSELQFPELQQHFKRFMGYVFLRWDDNFDLQKHVRLLSSPIRTTTEFQEIWQRLVIEPYQIGHSPWEAVFVEDYRDLEYGRSSNRKFIVFFRSHHGIGDGLSVQNMLCSLDPDYVLEKPVAVTFTPFVSFYKNFLSVLQTVVFGPFQLLARMVRYQEGYHKLHLPAEEHAKEYYIVESPFMHMETVKQIKNKMGVCFTAVLLAVVSGGIRRFLKGNRIPFPELLTVGIHFVSNMDNVDTLRNDFLIAPVNIPINSAQPSQRIMDIQRQFNALRCSTVPKMLSWFIDILSCFPLRWMRNLTKKSICSTGYSTIPGPKKQITLPGQWKLDEVNFVYGTGCSSLGLCFSTITYLGRFRMTIFADKNLMEGQHQANEMVECITEEYQCLRDMTINAEK